MKKLIPAIPTIAIVFGILLTVITAIVLVASSIRNKQGSGLPAALGLNYFREER